jgi:hypothetical protein
VSADPFADWAQLRGRLGEEATDDIMRTLAAMNAQLAEVDRVIKAYGGDAVEVVNRMLAAMAERTGEPDSRPRG